MTIIRRNNDWPEALSAAVNAARHRPFVWGSNDCALFAADVIEAMTGTDVAKKFRGKYKTARGAAGQMKRFAGGGIPELADKIAEQYGLDAIEPAFAQRGDVVQLDAGDDIGPCLGICIGANFVAAGPDCLSEWPLVHAQRAWRIG